MSTSRSPGTPMASGSTRAVGVAQLDDDVLQRVGRRPVAVVAAQVGAGVHQVDERRDGRRVGRVLDAGRRGVVERLVRRRRHLHGLDVGGVVARRAAHERVLADLDRGEELLARRAAHRPRHRRHDDVRQAEAVERGDVGVTVALVRALEAGVVDVEAVGVLHHELAAAQQPGPRPGLVAVLRLDLVDDERQVLVRRVQVLHEQREHLLVGRREQEVVAPAVLQPEQVVAVVGPAATGLVRLAGEQGGEVDLLEAGPVHLLADDPLDVAVDDPAERQPREPARRGPPDVPGPHQQPVARHLGVGGIVTQGAEEQRRHPEHAGRLSAPRNRSVGARYADRPFCWFCVGATERRGRRPTPCLLKGGRCDGQPRAGARARARRADRHRPRPRPVRRRAAWRHLAHHARHPARIAAGITLDDLALASRLVSRTLDEHDPMPGRYTLEVTSPGVERSLRTPAHFQREVGKVVAIRLADVGHDDRRVTGTLVAADDSTATVAVETPTVPPSGSSRSTRSIAPRPSSSGVRGPEAAAAKEKT